VDEKGLVVAKVPLLGNTLVAVCPAKTDGSNAQITIETLADFPKAKLAIAGPTVPAGIYGRQALKHQHWLEKLEQQEQLVIGNNVRETLAYVERGEAELGIVYATDAMISKNVKVVHRFAADSHDPIVYPLALVKSEADRSDIARQFFEYLQSEQAKSVFEKYGFQVLSH
jgi:molybdate transport system substrate-binding protein